MFYECFTKIEDSPVQCLMEADMLGQARTLDILREINKPILGKELILLVHGFVNQWYDYKLRDAYLVFSTLYAQKMISCSKSEANWRFGQVSPSENTYDDLFWMITPKGYLCR